MAPDVDELCVSHVAAWQGKLNAGVDVSIRRNIASRVARAAWQGVQRIFIDALWRSAELFNVSDKSFVLEDLSQCSFVDIQTEYGPISIHHGSDRGVDDKLRVQFGGQSLHAGIVLRIVNHQHIRDDDVNSVSAQQANGVNRLLQGPGTFGRAGVTSGGR